MSMRKPYPSDVTDEQWELVGPVITAWKARHPSVSGHQGKYAMREIVNAILYQNRTGCQWEFLPHDMPPPGAVKYYFYLWRDEGTDQDIHDLLRWQLREKRKRLADPSLVVLDTQSVHAAQAYSQPGTLSPSRSPPSFTRIANLSCRKSLGLVEIARWAATVTFCGGSMIRHGEGVKVTGQFSNTPANLQGSNACSITGSVLGMCEVFRAHAVRRRYLNSYQGCGRQSSSGSQPQTLLANSCHGAWSVVSDVDPAAIGVIAAFEKVRQDFAESRYRRDLGPLGRAERGCLCLESHWPTSRCAR